MELSAGQVDPTMKGILKPATRPKFINLNRMGKRAQRIDPMDFKLPSDLRVGNIPGVVDVLPY